MEKMKVIVTAVNKYDFQDRETGRQVQGCSVHFVDLTLNQSEYLVGFLPGKATVDYMMFDRLSRLEMPHLCEAEVTINLASKNKSWKITDFTPLEKIEWLNESLMSV